MNPFSLSGTRIFLAAAQDVDAEGDDADVEDERAQAVKHDGSAADA